MPTTTPSNPSRRLYKAAIDSHRELHRPTRAAKSLRCMTQNQKSEVRRRATALHASEAAGGLSTFVGQAVWARAHIPADFLQEDAKLSASCWPAYLYLSPLERTRQFTTQYVQAFTHYAKRLMELRKVDSLCLIDPVLEHNAPANISSLWRARQKADELGIPYEKYLFPLIRHALEEEGHSRIPLPNQLYDIAQLTYVHDQWEEWVRDGVFTTREWDCRLKAVNFRGNLAQLHCHEVLLGLIGQSIGRLEQFMLRDGLLPEAIARERLGDELVQRALARHGSVSASNVSGTPATYIRPCLGLIAERSPACAGCPFDTQCTRVAQAVDREMGRVYGSIDPRRDHKRMLARERKRRQRAKIRENVTLTVPGTTRSDQANAYQPS